MAIDNVTTGNPTLDNLPAGIKKKLVTNVEGSLSAPPAVPKVLANVSGANPTDSLQPDLAGASKDGQNNSPGPQNPSGASTTTPDQPSPMQTMMAAGAQKTTPPVYGGDTDKTGISSIPQKISEFLGLRSPRPKAGEIAPGEMIPDAEAQPQPTPEEKASRIGSWLARIGNTMALAGGGAKQQEMANERLIEIPRLNMEYGLRREQMKENQLFRQAMLGERWNAAQLSSQTKLDTTGMTTNARKLAAGYDANNNPLPLDQLSIPQQTKMMLYTTQQKLNQARIDAASADPTTPAGRVAQFKLKLAEMNANSMAGRSRAALEQANIASDKYLGDYFGVDSNGQALNGVMTDDNGRPMGVKVAEQFKAPGSMVQTAGYAQGALGTIQESKFILNDLAEKGILDGVAKNKMENWLFGNGLVDPSLPPDVQYEISQLKNNLMFVGSGEVRAHTGRSADDMRKEFNQANSMGQAIATLNAALDVGQKVMSGYAGQATYSAQRKLRTGTSGTPNSNPSNPSAQPLIRDYTTLKPTGR